MNTRTVDPRTIWAVLAMEAGLALPLMSLPTQGDRLPGLLGPVLLLAMLPVGYLAVYEVRELRDPSWRLLSGIGIALVTRGIVSSVPEPGVTGLAVWLGHSFVPAAIGVGLWWRGGSLGVAELTAADVRTEFSVLAVCMLTAIALIRPFLLPDPVLLGGSVGLFAVGGLVATALSRQDAAEAVSLRFGRTLAATTALLPAVAAVFLVSILRPALLGTLWSILGKLIELALTPIGLLVAWLASLFPRGAPAPPAPLPRPTPEALPNTAALAEAQDRLAWIVPVIVITLLLAVTIAALLVVRMLLADYIGAPTGRAEKQNAELTAESTGAPGEDAHAFLGWLMRWLRGQLGRRGRSARSSAAGGDASAADAWTAYRRLLEWAERQGLPRRPAETTGQLQARLGRHAPTSADAVDLLTTTYEWERYGAVHPTADLLRRVQAALRSLVEP